ncbi:MAG: OsmC family protein [Candidatus Thorarchaeota archaeon]|nr:OsmC family protein [Candidatus Thorarchaeota archaeon]
MRLKTKYPEFQQYRSQTDWDGATGALATTGDGHKLKLDTPKTYGGNGDGLCPDETFTTAVLGCLNDTFLDFQRRFEMELISLHLEGTTDVKFDGQGYMIAGIKVKGEIVVGQDELDVGKRCAELMTEYCHLYRTMKDCIPFEFDISVREIDSD